MAEQTLEERLGETDAAVDVVRRLSDGLQARVQRIEDDVREMKSDLKTMLKDLSYLRGKADSAPSTLQLIAFAIAVFVAAGITRLFGH